MSKTLILLISVLLWLGPLFETLPRAVLSGIIVVSLKGMIWQFKDVKRYYTESNLDALVWIVTFLAVVLIEIDMGLLIGFIVSVFVFYMKGFKSYSCNLGQVPGTDIYVDTKIHKNVFQDKQIKIFRFFGSINFATCSGFKQDLYINLGIDLRCIRNASTCSIEKIKEHNKGMEYVVVDLQGVSHLDIKGYKKLTEIKKELKLMQLQVFLAVTSDVVYDSINKAVNLGELEFEIFPTVHDAVLYIKKLV